MAEGPNVRQSVDVRSATAEDLLGIQRIAVLTWRSTYAGLIPDTDIETFWTDAYDHERLRLMLDWLGSGLIVAIEDGEVIGYAMTGRNRDRVAELFAIYVLPEWQGGGATTLAARVGPRL